MASLKKNIIYSSILTISGYLFPLLTFPYVTRVLGVNNIGICNFVDSIVHYFIIFSMMGVTTVGIREVAKTKSNQEELSKTYSSLIVLNLLFTFTAIGMLFLCTLFVSKLQCYSELFYIGAAKILANSLLIEWLYKGLENFRYITVRTVVVRSIYVLSVFLFVKEADDYDIYFFLTTMMFVVNAVVNVAYSRNFVDFSLRNISFSPYIKPYIVLGVYMILTNLYTTFNVMYLGFATDETQVGYYTTATKLYAIIMSFFSAFTGVMMPRMSSLLSEGKFEDFRRLTTKSVEALMAFAMPMILISEICAPQIITFIAGTGYEGSIMPMRIVMPLMLIIGYEQIIILQMLTPMKKDSAIFANSIIGASVGVLFNILLVSQFGSTGTAIVWVVSEISVLISAQFFVTKYIGYKMPILAFIKRLFLAIPIIGVCWLVNQSISGTLSSLFIVAAFASVSWLLVEALILKNRIIIDNLKHVLKRFTTIN